ncbi:hypothetical protein HGRIS_000661 [Hohenbuehelia grisea]|uniref:Cytochrome P450 n=1 Tax=Hohenbuehelia grisea TaxID=104357 RepID=A0ABR3JRN0_9AGAR
MADESHLPYITALVNEVLRWQPIVPLGIAHKSTTEGVYNGYRIPENSVIFPNIWAILHDEKAYPEPEVFRPERFLTQDGQLDPDVRDPAEGFGFGRRICPGRHLVFAALWLSVASTLSTMKISKATRPDGTTIEPSAKYASGLLSHPLPFKCTIRPRSKEAEELIRNTIIQP